MKIKDTKTALKLFEEASKMQGEATEQGDYKAANRYYSKITQAATFLKNENRIDTLLTFLTNPAIGIRLWAAYYLLPVHEQEGIQILEEIKAGLGIHSLTAETTLREWKDGKLHP